MEQFNIAAKLAQRLFEDDHYLFVAKPAGLALAASGRGRNAGIDALTTIFNVPTLLPVHPLDQHISGVLPLAKSAEAATRLIESLGSPRSSAEYLAIVEGDLPYASSTGKRFAKTPAPDAPTIRVRRRRRGRSLVSFDHPASRTAEVRAALRTARLFMLGEARRRRDQRPTRQVGRLFLHRAEIKCRHPYSGRTLTVKAPPPRAFETAHTASDLLEDTLQVALNARIPCLVEPDTDAFRLFSGKPDGVAGLVADAFGPVIILQTHQGKFEGDLDRIRRVAKWYKGTLAATAVYHKRFVKGRDRCPADDPELHSSTPLLGERAPVEVTIRENGLRLLVRPYEGLSPGLFLDQRENRRRVREAAKGKRVLNVFAYTCGFSVAAAAGGAAQTVSVDLSAKALEWGRRNFAANRIAVEDHLFVRSEVFDYFKRARRQGRTFDLVILDAPTFARSKKPARTFSVLGDLERLIVEAAGVLAPDGVMLVCTNNRACSVRWLGEQVAAAAGRAGRPFQITAAPRPPPGFAADPAWAKGVFVRFA